jgi:ammonium transporter, Amt family
MQQRLIDRRTPVKTLTAAPSRPWAAALALGAILAPTLGLAQDTPVPDKGDTAWMMTSTVLVILMTIPGLALFYAGMVRQKNVLSLLMQVFMTFCLISLLWAIYGYSLAFTNGNDFIGGFDRLFLQGLTSASVAATFSKGVYIPEYTWFIFQLTFACITPCLIVGAFAERIKFSAVLLFVVLWFTFAYLPMAHMVWWWAGPTPTPTPRPARQPRRLRASCSRRARSTLPAARSCTSMPASRASSAR